MPLAWSRQGTLIHRFQSSQIQVNKVMETSGNKNLKIYNSIVKILKAIRNASKLVDTQNYNCTKYNACI